MFQGQVCVCDYTFYSCSIYPSENLTPRSVLLVNYTAGKNEMLQRRHEASCVQFCNTSLQQTQLLSLSGTCFKSFCEYSTWFCYCFASLSTTWPSCFPLITGIAPLCSRYESVLLLISYAVSKQILWFQGSPLQGIWHIADEVRPFRTKHSFWNLPYWKFFDDVTFFLSSWWLRIRIFYSRYQCISSGKLFIALSVRLNGS